MLTTSAISTNPKIHLALARQDEMLTVQEFIDVVGFNISSMYIDRFWNSLNNNTWVYVDEKLLEWLGYSNGGFRKRDFNKILKDNFTEIAEYTVIKNSDMKKIMRNPTCYTPQVERNMEIRYNNNKNHIIVHPITFKMACMMINTKKAKQIRFYFVKLEELFKLYVAYQFSLKSKETEHKIRKLEFKCKIRDQMRKYQSERIKKTGYVYIQSSKKYTLEGLFKIGYSKNSAVRNASANTFRIQEDEVRVLYEIKSYDYKSLEHAVHRILKSRKHDKEWFHFPYKKIVEIIETVDEGIERGSDIFNSFITNLPDKLDEKDWYEGVDMLKFDGPTLSVTTGGKTRTLNIDDMTADDKKLLLNLINSYIKKEYKVSDDFDVSSEDSNQYNISWNGFKPYVLEHYNQSLLILRKAVKKVTKGMRVHVKR